MLHDPVSIHDVENSATLTGGVSAMTEEAKNRLTVAATMIETMVTNRPALALGAAMAAGVFLGWLIKRR